MPIKAQVQIQGLDKLTEKLGRAIAPETLQGPLRRAADNIRDRLSKYPPERPGQAYERTGNLGRGWQAAVSGSRVTVSNAVSYAPWVQGDKTQARMHRGRWLTDQQALDQARPEIQDDLAESIDTALQQ